MFYLIIIGFKNIRKRERGATAPTLTKLNNIQHNNKNNNN